MNANARIHLRRLATSWDGRPEIVRAWVAFFRRAIPWPPLPMLAVFGGAFAAIGMLSSGYDPFVEAGGVVSTASSAARDWLWRFVLLVGVAAGALATIPGAQASDGLMFRMLPWSRERHVTGVAMAVAVYAVVMAAVMLAVSRDAPFAFAAAGVLTLVMVCTASVSDILARAQVAMLVLGVFGILTVVPAPLTAVVEVAPIATGIAAVAGALWMLRGAFAPSVAVRQRAGTFDTADVRELMPQPMRRLVLSPVRSDPTDLPIVDRPGPPQTYKQWTALRRFHRPTLAGFIIGYLIFGGVMPLGAYLMDAPQMWFMIGMMPFYESNNRALRLPPVSRRLRARWAIRGAVTAGLMRLLVISAGVLAFAVLDPWPGFRDHPTRDLLIDVMALVIVGFTWILPMYVWFTTWLPRSTAPLSPEEMLATWYHHKRIWLVFLLQFVIGLVLMALTQDALRLLAPMWSAWSIAVGVAVIAIATNWICCRLIERRYLTKDLIK